MQLHLVTWVKKLQLIEIAQQQISMMKIPTQRVESRRLPRTEVRIRFEQLKSVYPKMRARDLALEIGTSESELLGSRTYKDIIRLDGDRGVTVREA